MIITAGQSIFQNELLKTIPITAPGLNPAAVVAAGATNLHSTFSEAELAGILAAYIKGLSSAFALAVAVVGLALLAGATQPWYRIKPEPKAKVED